MKVRLKDEIDWGSLPAGAKPDLTEGVTDVLEVFMSSNGEASYRILTSDGSNMLSPANYFTIIDNTFPKDWTLTPTHSGTAFKITYTQFLAVGFWEDYFDDEPLAVQTYDKVISDLH